MTTKTKKKKTSNKVIRRDLTLLNLILTVGAVLVNVLFCWSMVSITRYSSFSKLGFILINVIVLLLLLGGNILIFLLIKTKRQNFMRVVPVVMIVFALLSSFMFYATQQVNSSIGKITQTGIVKESVEASIVVYDENANYTVKDIDGLEGKTVGIVSNTSHSEIGKSEFEAKGVNVNYKEYEDTVNALLALFNGEIDAIVAPSNYVSMYSAEEGFSEYLEKTQAVSTFDKVVEVDNGTTNEKDLTTEPFTVLLMGTADGLSDAIMLASVNPISMNVTISSIARDSYVPIACRGGNSSKINSARANSRECLIKTVENLIGVKIDYYVDTNFKGVVEMVNALGGIVVSNPYEFTGQTSSSQRGHKTVWVPAGENVKLNGEQALAFARERKLYATGDFQRQANQQQVIEAIVRTVLRTRDVNVALNVIKAAGENVVTNFQVDQLIDFFKHVMQKTNRYYDKEHIEGIFNITGSRVTGYSNGLWDEGLQMSLYIYRLFDGSIADTRAAIQRNIDLTSKIDAVKSWSWNALWEFHAPTISNETYAEKVIVSEVPNTLANYVGKSIGKLQAWAKSFGVAVNPIPVTEGMPGYDPNLEEGTIVSQDIAAGTKAEDITVINVGVISKAKAPGCPTNSKGTYPNCDCSANTDGKTTYNKDKNECVAPTSGEVHKVIVRYKVSSGAGKVPADITKEVKEGETYSIASPALDGYTPDKAVVEGTMGKADVDVTVTYKSNTTAECPVGATGTYPNCACTDTTKQYDKATNSCKPKQETPTCGANASLVNGACVCNEGYVGDPKTGCTVKQETPTCGANASLVNGACVCDEGYVGDPKTGCTVKQETPTCGANASLVNGACVCDEGYVGDPKTGCTVKQETPTCGANASLVDGACVCKEGFVGDPKTGCTSPTVFNNLLKPFNLQNIFNNLLAKVK